MSIWNTERESTVFKDAEIVRIDEIIGKPIRIVDFKLGSYYKNGEELPSVHLKFEAGFDMNDFIKKGKYYTINTTASSINNFFRHHPEEEIKSMIGQNIWTGIAKNQGSKGSRYDLM